MTKTKISQVRYLEPAQIKKHKEELLKLANWICEIFGYRMVEESDKPDCGTVRPDKRYSRPIKCYNFEQKFKEKIIEYRNNNPAEYKKRKEIINVAVKN